MSRRGARTRAPFPLYARFFGGALSICAVFVVFLVAGAGSAWAASGDIVSTAYVTDGPVDAVVHDDSDGSTYIGGSFSKVGPRIGSGMVLEQSGPGIQPNSGGNGDPETSPFPEVAGGRVLAVAQDGLGGWFIGGDFDYVGTQLRHGLAHVNPDGSVDGSWNPGATGGQLRVDALAVSSGVVYVGGSFDTVDGQPRNNIAAVDASSGTALSAWNPGADGEVLTLAVGNGLVYAGGGFSSIGGQPRSHIGALDSNGDATSWAPDADGAVDALAVSGTTVYAGGGFSSIGGQPRSNIAALDSNGDATSWAPDASGTVDALAVSGTAVYAGGSFSGASSIGGADRDFLAALDPSTGNATDWNPAPNDVVRSLAVAPGLVYVGGDFSGVNSIGSRNREHVAALEDTTGAATTWNPNPNDSVLALGEDGSSVYAGGSFVTAGPNVADRLNIARLQADGTLDTTWNPGVDGTVRALRLSGGKLYVGGSFAILGEAFRSNLGALDAATGIVDPVWTPSAENEVRSLDISADGSTIYVGGYFLTLSDGTSTVGPYLGSVGSDGVVNAAWDPSPDSSPVNAIAVSGSTVYVSGGFGQIGGLTRAGLAALDASGGTSLAGSGWDDGVFPFGPAALTVSGGSLYAGGDFTGIGGAARSNIAALDPTTGVATSWDPNVCGGGVNALAVSPDGNTIYAGGEFAFLGDCLTGPFRNDLAAIDAVTGAASAWNPFPNQAVNALAVSGDGNTVYAGGDFTVVGGHAATYFAQIDSTQVGFTASPNGTDFGNQIVGQQSASQTFTITNGGILDLHISTASVVGTDAGDFPITDDQCSGATVAPGNTCTVDVAFDPILDGAKSASLEFTDDAGGSPQHLTLTGTGVPNLPAASIAPSSRDFGGPPVGSVSTAQQFTITNTGVADLMVSGVSLNGADPGQFRITGDGCGGATVPPSLTCTVSAAFAPTSAGAKSAQLEISDDALDTPQAASLSGTGTSTAPPGPVPMPSGGGGGRGAGGAKLLDTAILKAPKKKTKRRSATFKFSSTPAGLQFECKLDKRGFSRCSSPMKVKRLKPGKHTFKVRAVDGSGNRDGSPATVSWKIKK